MDSQQNQKITRGIDREMAEKLRPLLLPAVELFSVVVVARNEQDYLPFLLADLREQDFSAANTEILLIDSLSTDGTKQLMANFRDANPQYRRVVVLDNQGRFLPHGCNLALREARGDALVRIDAHASVPPDFLRKSAECLNDGREVCGGPRPPVLRHPSPWKNLLLTAEKSVFGSGAALARRGTKPQAVKSVFHGAYRREVFERVGHYDERLRRTEDNDMSYRIRQAGYTIYFDPAIHSTQYIRASLGGFLRQKLSNGYWVGRTLPIQPGCIGFFNLVPAFFVLALILGTITGLLWSWLPVLLVVVAYLLAAVAATVLAYRSSQASGGRLALLPLLFFAMHVAYGLGTLVGLVRGLIKH
ncbi:MAG: glycosyltransferase family 2 protein [Coriobacteriales bacterium]|jgi:GT2 family glycosyltransferase|nr:glycosyltransferase family 2 protein [Coriobacteriales bacterium]